MRRFLRLAVPTMIILQTAVTPPAVAQSADSSSASMSRTARTAVDALLPRPNQVAFDEAATPLLLRAPIAIVVPRASARLREVASLLARGIKARTGLRAQVTSQALANGSNIRLDTMWLDVSSEAYVLTVHAGGASIHGASSAGALWGAQTLLQLLMPAGKPADGWMVPAVRINDAPRFGWRGSLVDVGRHWFPVRDLERHIDLLSRFKMNVFHWHLTEDQGWRIEIKRYPKLTSVGAWRIERDGSRYGGFYTQRDVRHLVEYARQRGITVVPEIEMPGHSSAAIAAYPSLGCTTDTLHVPTAWGVYADIYCAGKEETFTFLFNVLDEVMALFPSSVIHIGGDEVPKDRWKACAACQAVMQREGLKDEEALQTWFMGRIAAHVAKRGRRVTGWDEVLDGPYIAGGMVQSWRDSSFTRKALLRGHDVVASPGDFTYINQPANQVSLASVYRFEPVPPSLPAQATARVLGGEVTLWSEHITSGANLELMALPRMLAFAEVMWHAGPRDLTAFQSRMEAGVLPRLRKDGYAIGPADAPLVTMRVRVDSATHRPELQLPAMTPGVVVRATRDGRAPTAASPVVGDGAALEAPEVMRLQPFWNGVPILEERRVAFARHDAVGAVVTATPASNARYAGTGPSTLSDGLLGGTDHGDGLWQGWWGGDVQFVLDRGSARRADTVSVRFLQSVRSWIVFPSRVEFSWSDDGVRWQDAGTATLPKPVWRDEPQIEPFSIAVPKGATPRYVRIVARSAGALPAGHPGAGKASWIFADEIIVR